MFCLGNYGSVGLHLEFCFVAEVKSQKIEIVEVIQIIKLQHRG